MSPGFCVASFFCPTVITDQFKYKPEGCTNSWSNTTGSSGRGTRGRSENCEKTPTPSCARSTLSSTTTQSTTSTKRPNLSSSNSNAGGQHHFHQSHRQQEQNHQSHNNNGNNSSKHNSSNSSSIPPAAPVKGAAPVWAGGASNSICHPVRAPRKKKRLITVTGPRKRAPPPPPPPPPPLPNSTSSSRVHISSPAGGVRSPSAGTRAVASSANGSRHGGDTGRVGGNGGGSRAAEFMEDNDEICRELRRAHELLKQADAHALYKIVELQGMYEGFYCCDLFFFFIFPPRLPAPILFLIFSPFSFFPVLFSCPFSFFSSGCRFCRRVFRVPCLKRAGKGSTLIVDFDGDILPSSMVCTVLHRRVLYCTQSLCSHDFFPSRASRGGRGGYRALPTRAAASKCMGSRS